MVTANSKGYSSWKATFPFMAILVAALVVGYFYNPPVPRSSSSVGGTQTRQRVGPNVDIVNPVQSENDRRKEDWKLGDVIRVGPMSWDTRLVIDLTTTGKAVLPTDRITLLSPRNQCSTQDVASLVKLMQHLDHSASAEAGIREDYLRETARHKRIYGNKDN
jgi:hypothetical protein